MYLMVEKLKETPLHEPVSTNFAPAVVSLAMMLLPVVVILQHRG